MQLAKSFGTEVTGVDNTRKLETMRSMGADFIIDYTKENFTKNGQCYDLILDLAAYHSIFDYQQALSSKGIYAMVGGSVALMFHLLFLGSLLSMIGRKKMGILAMKTNKDMAHIIALFETGKLFPVIDKCYPLSEVPEALQYLGEGKARGKVIITFEHNDKTCLNSIVS